MLRSSEMGIPLRARSYHAAIETPTLTLTLWTENWHTRHREPAFVCPFVFKLGAQMDRKSGNTYIVADKDGFVVVVVVVVIRS